jgi:hypothetical protein
VAIVELAIIIDCHVVANLLLRSSSAMIASSCTMLLILLFSDSCPLEVPSLTKSIL